jgi:tRNA(Ile)-lysidine synthase TilS/MesJ
MNNNVDPSIKFTSDGLCNHCQRYDHLKSSRLNLDNTALDKIVSRIKASGNRKEYDWIVGVSGGVDSTYVAFLVKKMGLRPLAVHVDNGWNSELAVKNIENTLKKLNIDLVTNVLDWDLDTKFLNPVLVMSIYLSYFFGKVKVYSKYDKKRSFLSFLYLIALSKTDLPVLFN